MKKILFGITSLSYGGAERVLIDIVNKLKDEYDITVFSLYKGQLESQLDSNVKLVRVYDKSYNELTKLEKINMSITLSSRLLSRRLLAKYLDNEYDRVIAFLEGPITWLFDKFKINKIVWVHNDISKVFNKGIRTKLKQLRNKKSYKRYNKIIFVSKDNMNNFNSLFKINKEQKVIYNYIDKVRILEKCKEKVEKIDKDCPILLSVCRLTKQKGIDRLVKCHKKIIEEGFYHKMYIVGTGEEEKTIKELIKTLQVEDTFILLGAKANPYPYINMCDCFMLMSHYEGYPMTLLEAKILNKKIIITNTASREALIDYPNVTIVENNDISIIDGIKSILKENKALKQYTFNNEDILEEIKEVIK